MKNSKGNVYQIVMKNFQYTEDRHYLKIFIIIFQKKKYLSFFVLDFKYSDLTDVELTSLCQILIKDKDVYSRYKYDVRLYKTKISQ